MSVKPNQEKLFTSSCEHYLTPPHIVDKVVDVFDGNITLDPCANEAMNIPAEISYTKDTGNVYNGLVQYWGDRYHSSNVYINPPYGRQIGKWTKKAAVEFAIDPRMSIILLIPARVDTRWFQEMIVATSPLNRVCFWKGRLGFSTPNYTGKVSGAPFPSAIILLSHNTEHFRKFEEVFAHHGLITGF